MTASTPPPLPPGPPALPVVPVPARPDAGRPKMTLNLVAAALTTILALWLTVADFAYPGNLLFQDSASLLLVGLYLSTLFLLVLVLAVFPKRVIIGANLLILARGAMGWPLSLVIDHSLACRILSLALLVLSLYYLASSLRRPLLALHLRPWLNGKHSIVAVLVWVGTGILTIPVLLFGYLEASKSLLGHYVQFSFQGINLVERVFEKDDQRVHLIGMMHIGDGTFYTDLNRRMRTAPETGRRLVLTEGVADAQGILPEGFKSGETYAKLAAALGLKPQNAPQKPGPASRQSAPSGARTRINGVTFQNADIDVSALDERHKTVLVAILDMLDVDNMSELLLAQPEGITGRDVELLLFDGLLGQRNDVLMDHLAESGPGFSEVFIPWGAAHLPDIEQRLLGLGYTQQDEVVRPIVRFGRKPPPPAPVTLAPAAR